MLGLEVERRPVPHRQLADLLRAVLPQLGELYAHVPRDFGDASWVGARLAELLPIGLPDKQACLELDDALDQWPERFRPPAPVLNPLASRAKKKAQR